MITIRTMCSEDVSQIAALEAACFSMPWSENSISYELSNPLSLWLVACDSDHVVGYIGSQTVIDETDIMNVAVDSEYRRNGIGQKLLCELIRQLMQKNVKAISLEVRASNDTAISLYRKFGFETVGRRPGYYRMPKEDALILRKELA